MNITKEMVLELRRATGGEFGLMDCKIALTKSGGDFEKAKEYLRNMSTLFRLITRKRD